MNTLFRERTQAARANSGLPKLLRWSHALRSDQNLAWKSSTKPAIGEVLPEAAPNYSPSQSDRFCVYGVIILTAETSKAY